MNLNERDPTLPASGLEDRAYGHNQIGHFDCAGDFPASRNCTWNVLGRLQIKGFSIGATACTLIVAVILGQLGNFVIPPLFKSIFFSLFVFTIGYKSGPEFFASLSFRTLSQVGVALVVGTTGLLSFSPSPLSFIWIPARLQVLRPAVSRSRP